MPDGFASVESWNNKDIAQKLLPSHITTGRLVVVLGAGVSSGCGLPSWNVLINNAYTLSGEVRNTAHNDEMAAEHLFTQLVSRNEQEFAKLIGRALYYNLDERKVLQSELFEAIGAVVMLASRMSAGTVITYNFDDLLETYLSRLGVFAYPVIEQPCWFHNEDVSVLHPHGFVSRSGDYLSSSRITFTARHFDEQTGRSDNPWRNKIIDIFERNTPLFIGLSGNDKNLTSQLTQAQGRHVSISDAHPYWGIRISLESDSANNLWKERGIWCLTVKDFSEIPPLLLEVCKASADIIRTQKLGNNTR